MKETIVKVLKAICYTILVILVIFNIIIFAKSQLFPKKVPGIFGYKPFVVLSNSMKDVFNIGDLIIVKEVNTDDLEKGDIISFRTPQDFVTTHRINSLVERKGSICYITKGDNNNSEDKDIVCPKKVEGIYVGKIPKLGGLVLFIQEPIGFAIMMIFIVIVCLLIYFSNYDDEKDRNDGEDIELKRKGKKI